MTQKPGSLTGRKPHPGGGEKIEEPQQDAGLDAARWQSLSDMLSIVEGQKNLPTPEEVSVNKKTSRKLHKGYAF